MTAQPTETLTLAAFLSARLDDDEKGARAAEASDGADWTAKAADFDSASWSVRGKGGWAVASNTINARDVPGSMTCSTAPHIARHDPARVLADVEAKQRIVALHASYVEPANGSTVGTVVGESVLGLTLRLLALPYAGHPDFDESWRP